MASAPLVPFSPFLPSSKDEYTRALNDAIANAYRTLANRLEEVIIQDTFANRPVANGTRRFFFAEDTNTLYFDDGAWVTLATAGAAIVASDPIWDAKGDLAVGTGPDTADNLPVGADDAILMADSGGGGGVFGVKWQAPATAAEIADVSTVEAAGTSDTWTRGDHVHALASNVVTDAKLRDSGPLSVIGRSANSSGDPADISAVAASGAVLRESGSTIGFGTIASAGIANDAITDAKLRNSGALSVIGRSANSAGDPADISATAASGAVLRESGSVIGFGTIATAGIANDAVTYAKIQNVTNDRVLLRDTAGAGDVEEGQLGTYLEFTGGPGIDAKSKWITINKSVDESITSDATLNNDSELKFAMIAGGRYRFRAFIIFATGPTADFKWRHTGPAAANGILIRRQDVIAAGTADNAAVTDYAYSAADIVLAGAAGAGSLGWIKMEGWIFNGANAGDFRFQWSQNTSNGETTTVARGSFIEYATA